MENEERLHESSNHFCFRRDESGYLKSRCIVDRIDVMLQSERELYGYEHFLPQQDVQQYYSLQNPALIVDPEWRANIVKWVRISWTSMCCLV